MRIKDLTDSELINRTMSGDNAAFEGIVLQYKSALLNIITGIIGNNDVVEEICQDTFINFYKSLNKFRFESSIKTYITRIAINLSLNELKRRKRNKVFSFIPYDDKISALPDKNQNIPKRNLKKY